VPLEIAPAVIGNTHWFVEVDGNQHIDAVAGIETRAQKSVYCYEFCYGEEREAETKVPPSAPLVAGQ
jgi:hypothetical protein